MAVSRRTFVQSSLLGAVGVLAAPTSASAAVTPHLMVRDRPASEVDCIVVGAGLSGLAAARRLREEGKRVVVLEGRGRPGGRVVNVRTPGGRTVDGGAEFVGPTQDAILALAGQYAVPTLKTYNQGWSLYRRTPLTLPFLAGVGLPVDLGTPQVLAAMLGLDGIFKTFPVGRPWEHPNAADWDAMTFQDWIDANASHPSARLQLSLACSSTLSVKPTEVSALFMLNYMAAAGGPGKPGTVTRLLGVKDGAQERFFDGGAARIPEAMARAMSDSLVYNAKVTGIHEANGTCTVLSSQGVFTAPKVIVAMSPAIMDDIEFTPGLPPARRAVHAGYRMGSIGKFFAAYRTPFWRSQWKSGQVIGDGSPIDVTFESYGPGQHFLMGFISHDNMRRFDSAPEAEVMEACTRILVSYFGPKARTAMVDRALMRWDNEPFSRGGPTGVTGMGVLTEARDALTAPVGGVHWAGTETATYWTGYMDGAVTSGYRAASEVASALKRARR